MQSVYHQSRQQALWRNWFHRCNQFLASVHEKSTCKPLSRLHCKFLLHQQLCLARYQAIQKELFQMPHVHVLALVISKTLNVLLVHIKYELTFPQVNCTMNYQFIVNY